MEMLIDWETTELNIKAFKKVIPTLKWVKKPRKIGDIEEMWYRGDYEDDTKIIQVVVRPSMRMQVTETYKNRLKNGTAPKEGQKPSATTPFMNFGCTSQVLVDEDFVKHIDSIAKPFQKKQVQKISWS